MRTGSTVFVAAATLWLSGCGDGSDVDLRAAIIDTEDARAAGPAGLQPLEDGLASSDPDIQRLAVRAVGRLEKPENIGLVVPLLASPDASVRAEAVNALGQSVLGADGDEVADRLFAHLANEEDGDVRGVVARTLGRLQYGEADRAQLAEQMLVQLMSDEADPPLSTLTGAVMGLESFSRGLGAEGLSGATLDRLQDLAAFGRSSRSDDPDGAARIRRTAMLALSWFGNPRATTLAEALDDDDPDVRRLAVTIMGREASADVSIDLLVRGLDDPSARVRVEAVRSYAARVPGSEECPRLFDAAVDVDYHVAVAALDLLGQECEERTSQTQLLAAIAAGHEMADPSDWHRPAHALVSLASVSAGQAAPLLEAFAAHTNPFARVYAARAATILGEADALEALATDAVPNVRTAAVQGLARLRGHEVDDVLIAQLAQDDPFLLLTVARLLEGTPDRSNTVAALFDALDRISQARRQTARDPRMALVNRIAELGGGDDVSRLEPYLTDYDPVLAERVAEILNGWTGGDRQAQTNPVERSPVPSPEEIDALADTRVVLEMARGGEIEIRMLAHNAPTHAARFVRLARAGSLDGLTYHRVVTNFVLQGGSPGSNEFYGDAAYSRDELGLMSHWRGTVGTSTRGRDTGDGQMFINLIDNLRLDHNYTVFGEVVRGMDTADLVAEGDVITRARVEEG